MPAHRAFRRRFAHSHSASQFLPHLPSHWYSNILPPHCGQTRLRIDERMRTFNSPGGASMVIMFEVSRDPARAERGQNDGGMPRGFCALCDAPNWVGCGVRSCVSLCPLAQHGASNLDATLNRQQKPLTKLVASKPGFYRADTWASNGHACPNSGAVWRIRNSEGAAARLIRSPAKMGRYRCDQKANENGESYRPGPQNQQLNNQVNEGATILFGR